MLEGGAQDLEEILGVSIYGTAFHGLSIFKQNV